MVASELNPAMAAMKAQVEGGAADIMEFPEAVRDALLHNRMLTPDPVQQLFEMRQYKCPICRSISGIIDEE